MNEVTCLPTALGYTDLLNLIFKYIHIHINNKEFKKKGSQSAAMGLQLHHVTQTIVITTVAATFTILSAFLYKKWKQVKIPSNWKQIGSVKKLYMYPLKSGHRKELDQAECTDVGFRQTEADEKVLQLRDRGLVVYGAKDNEFRTARTYPKMCLIDVAVHDENHLAIDAPTMRTLYVKIPNRKENNVTSIKCWNNERIFAIDCGDEAAGWFSRYIIERDSGLRLGYNDGNQRRDISKTHIKLLEYYKNLSNKSTGIYSDLSSVLLINHKSVLNMNGRIENSTISEENFRPNIVVDGPELKAFDEDNWEWIKIGDQIILRNVKECTRCIFTTIDPDNATRNKKREPLATLEKYRKSVGPEKSAIMGVNCEVQRTGIIKMGDPVYINVKDE